MLVKWCLLLVNSALSAVRDKEHKESVISELDFQIMEWGSGQCWGGVHTVEC